MLRETAFSAPPAGGAPRTARSSTESIWWRLIIPGAFALLFLVGCSELTTPSKSGQVDLSSLVAMAENGPVTGTVGAPADREIVVRVTDAQGRPASGAEVAFVPGASGAASPAFATADSDGRVTTRWTLGPKAGPQRLDVRLASGGHMLGVVRADALPGPPETVTVVPTHISLWAGVPMQLQAEVADRFGNTVSDATLEWISSDEAVAEVDGDGWVTGLRQGSVVVEAIVDGSGDEVTGEAPQGHHRPGHVGGRSTVEVREAVGGESGVFVASGDQQEGEVGALLPEALTVQVLGADGGPARQVDVHWLVREGEGTLSSSVTRTDGQGRATVEWTLGPLAGTQRVSAVVDDLGSVTFTATAQANEPGRVDDLAVSESGADWVRLQFTEVDDGTGSPAAYEVRYHVHPIGWGWGDASLVTEGSCEGVVEGRSVGETLTCTVAGLTPGTKYDLQLVSYRQEERRIFGDLSNVATGTPSGETGDGALAVSPGSVEFSAIEDEMQLTVEARDAEGRVLDAVEPTWTSTDPSVATVNAGGKVVAKGAGLAMIVASAMCCTPDSVAVAVDQVVESVEVSPGEATLSVGQSRSLSAVARDRNGFEVSGADLDWTSRDPSVATVAGNGTVAGVAEGATFVIAARGAERDSAFVRIDPGSDRYPNEPSGLTPWLVHDFSHFPNDGKRFAASGAGFISPDGTLPNYSVVEESSAPHGLPHSLRIRYPEGMADGVTPGRFFGRDVDGGPADATPLEEWYISVWVLFEGEDWEAPPATIKLWYNAKGNYRAQNRGGGMTFGSGVSSPTVVRDLYSFRFWYRECDNCSIILPSARPGPSIGEWIHLEQRVVLSDQDRENGRLQTWANGVLVQDLAIQNQASDGWDVGFYEFHWAPVYGGACNNRCPKARDDFMRIADLYVSGRPQR